MGEFEGLAAVVTGGGSGIGLATARFLAARGAKVACFDLKVDGLDPGTGRRRRRRVRRRRGPRRHRDRGRATRRHRHPGQQRRHRRGRHRRRQLRRRVAPGARRQRGRHGPGQPGGAAAPARLGPRRDRQHLLDRRDRRPAQPRALQREQGRGALADPGDGRRPHARGHPGQLRHARHRRHSLGAPAARGGRRSGRRARRAASPPAQRAAGLRRGGGGRDRLSWPARWPAPPPARCSTSTAACTACGCGPLHDPDAGVGLRLAGQPLSRDRRRACGHDGRRGLGRRNPLLRHRAALRSRLVRAPAGRGAGRPPPGRVHGQHQGRPACWSRCPAAETGWTTAASRCRPRTGGSGTSAATGCAAASTRASTGSGSTGSTWCCCTTRRTTPTRRSPRATRHWPSCGTRVWSARSAPAPRTPRSWPGSSPNARPTQIIVAGRYTLLEQPALDVDPAGLRQGGHRGAQRRHLQQRPAGRRATARRPALRVRAGAGRGGRPGGRDRRRVRRARHHPARPPRSPSPAATRWSAP